jgi:hypothetical protein
VEECAAADSPEQSIFFIWYFHLKILFHPRSFIHFVSYVSLVLFLALFFFFFYGVNFFWGRGGGGGGGGGGHRYWFDVG